MGTNNFLLSDMSRRYSGGAWTSNSLIKQQLKQGDHTRQIVGIMQDISNHKDKFPSFIGIANKKCHEYFVSIKGKPRRNVVGDLGHGIAEAVIFRGLFRKYKTDICDIETKMTRGQNARRGDLVIRADPEALKKLNDLLGAGLTDNDLQRIKYFVIDITLSDNYALLTTKEGRSKGKVWKGYQSPESLLLMFNNDPAKAHCVVDKFNLLLHKQMDKIEIDLSTKMSRSIRIPNKKYIRFIHLKYIAEIFDLDATAREELDTLSQHVDNALYSKTYSRTSSYEFLYEWYAKESRFLKNLEDYYGIGGRILSDLPF